MEIFIYFLSQRLDFVDKIRKIVRIKEEKIGDEKIICLFFDPNWVYTRPHSLWQMPTLPKLI